MRVISLLLIKHNGKILAEQGKDSQAGTVFYRMIGGGIEEGETAVQAVRREFMEELGLVTANEKVLTVIENIFTYEGKPGHEIVFVCEGEFANPADYDKETYQMIDKPGQAEWVPIKDIKGGGTTLYPDKIDKYM